MAEYNTLSLSLSLSAASDVEQVLKNKTVKKYDTKKRNISRLYVYFMINIKKVYNPTDAGNIFHHVNINK